MDLLTVLVLLIAVTLIAAAVYLVTVCEELKKTLFAARELIKRVDTEVDPILTDLRSVVSNAKIASEAVASHIDEVKSAMEAVGDTGRNVSRINSAVCQVADLVTRVSLLSAGAKAAGKYLRERISQKRR
ncbi:MAG: DUF948 domain-containing protein [Deltaproteobacteria bacterium]|nr:DUF948 domain-containing protein [Deltaproteobacteria bacterium]